MPNIDLNQFYRNYCEEDFDAAGNLARFRPVYAPDFNFAYDIVDRIAEDQPDRTALVWCSDKGGARTFTYGQLSRLSGQAAGLFARHGVKQGDMVMLLLGRSYQFWICLLALHKLGAVAACCSDMVTRKDLLYRFPAADARFAVCAAGSHASRSVERACQSGYGGLTAKFTVNGSQDGWVDFDRELSQAAQVPKRVPTQAGDPMLLYFTSGTTGYPKMAWHDFTYPLAHLVAAKYWSGVTPDSLHLSVADTGWAKASWGKIYGPLFFGASLFVYDYEKFSPEGLLGAITGHGVTSLCAPPTVYRYLLQHGAQALRGSAVTCATTTGEALSAEVHQRFLEATGLCILEAFGQTETAALTMNPVGTEPKPGSMGLPSPLYQLDLVDQYGMSVLPGEAGELVVRLPETGCQVGLFRGYYRNPEQTAESLRDGLFHTGDVAWRDETGCLWYVGRTDDLIKASGYRIGPYEIESVLAEHPAVAECAVTGAPDPVRGTVVKATIVPADGFEPSGALIEELQGYVKEQTAPYKYPRIIEFTDSLPKTEGGKVKRGEIRRRDQANAGTTETTARSL